MNAAQTRPDVAVRRPAAAASVMPLQYSSQHSHWQACRRVHAASVPTVLVRVQYGVTTTVLYNRTRETNLPYSWYGTGLIVLVLVHGTAARFASMAMQRFGSSKADAKQAQTRHLLCFPEEAIYLIKTAEYLNRLWP